MAILRSYTAYPLNESFQWQQLYSFMHVHIALSFPSPRDFLIEQGASYV
jgi:hypothetical protein